MRVARNPGDPTDKEVEEHNVTHLPHRSWCPVCVKARGKEEAHKKVRGQGEVPTVVTHQKTRYMKRNTQMLKSEAVSTTKDAVAESVERLSGTTETRSAAAKRPAEHAAEQPPPDALPVEMRTHDDLGQSSRSVLYGEADGDVEAALGSGTSLAPQQHDEIGVSESPYFPGKRRRLDIIAESARRLLGKFGMGKSAGCKSIWNE